jgi:hypothetical protein
VVNRNYWLDLFTGTTWQEFLDAGAKVSGFREGRWKTVQRIKQGDYFLCYLTGVSRWIGALEVTSEPYWDESPLWREELFPCRVEVKPIVTLTPENAVPVHHLRDELSIFENLSNPNAWTGRFRGSPSLWKQADGEAVIRVLLAAEKNPVSRPFDQRKLDRRPRSITGSIGPVVVPDDATDGQVGTETAGNLNEVSAHPEIQWLLLKLGSDLGLGVWVARNDRSKSIGANEFATLRGMRPSLPHQFDEATNRTIELIDVLWLQGNTIVAAFEIESTTSIYSGLLRMSDLLSMQPNLKIPLYLVAPDERRDKVISEINRPTFSRLTPPMRETCRFISFTALRDRIAEIGPWVQYMKPDLLIELSESCDADESP